MASRQPVRSAARRPSSGTPPRFSGEHLERLAFPLGGIGAGMMALTGTGALTHVSLRHRPDFHHEPAVFAGLYVKGHGARVVEGPVATKRVTARPRNGLGFPHATYGLPRFARAEFTERFPFADLALRDPALPVAVDLTGWSPFIPGDADASGLPVTALEYTLKNTGREPVSGVFSYHVPHFMRTGPVDGTVRIEAIKGGFVLHQDARPDHPEAEGALAVFTGAAGAKADCAWFRGAWWDTETLNWEAVERGRVRRSDPHAEGGCGGGASLFVPFRLAPGAEKNVPIQFAWYVPHSDQRDGEDPPGAKADGASRTYVPWYAAAFPSIGRLVDHWRGQYAALRRRSAAFGACLRDTTLPPEVTASVAATLGILRSPTCLRQFDGRFWAWEGCNDDWGSCHGSCTHVWNYAQALPHLFPGLERTLRESEFFVSQDERGHQAFRTSLPIRPTTHTFHAAADGQLGGLMKLHREWRVLGDDAWLRGLWPRARASMDYAVRTWDPDRAGLLTEPHHNTYDIEFWGPDAMCSSFYLGALEAMVRMGAALGDDVAEYAALRDRSRSAIEDRLWNGEFYVQRVWRETKRIPDGASALAGGRTPEVAALVRREGPPYQYGEGCLIDGVLGDWMARMCGLGPVLDPKRTAAHARAVFRHNFREGFDRHANPQRATYAFGADDAGVLNCTWPRGGKPSLPFVYSDEVWTGCEYALAGLLAMGGRSADAVRVLRAIRGRYDGRVRNPFDEYECGHWYARALSSYGLLAAFTGVRYDAAAQTLRLGSAKGDFRVFLSTATGFGTAGVKNGKPFLDVKAGRIPVKRFVRE